jgi:hypothetical protein
MAGSGLPASPPCPLEAVVPGSHGVIELTGSSSKDVEEMRAMVESVTFEVR